MKIWHISDTHTFHWNLTIPEGIDMVLFSGDCSNPQALFQSEKEIKDFIHWFGNLPIKHKVMIAGNHDLAIEHGYVIKQDFIDKGIIYLENSEIVIEGLKIWGSPVTPAFGQGWAFNERRDRLHDLWATIPEDTDIIITHGPPKGVLDMSYHWMGYGGKPFLEYCGCEALRKRCLVIKPKLVCFGHIHDNEDNYNSGVTKLSDHQTLYSNGCVLKDGRFDFGPKSNGNLFEYKDGTIKLIDFPFNGKELDNKPLTPNKTHW
jgi:Icc-related predicted phosphoesterase